MNALLLIFSAWTLAQPGAVPQEPPAPQEAPVLLSDVMVDGVSEADRARDFVDEVMAVPRGRGPARWDRRVCVGVANLQAPIARYLIDRISSVAMEVGLRAGEPGCRAEVLVVGASDGGEMARAMVRARPRAFRVGGSGMDRGRAALEDFQATGAPVRWWHVSLPVTEAGAPAVALPGRGPAVSRNEASRIRTLIRNELRSVIIIVDVERSGGVSLEQLGDYLAMVALAQVDSEAEMARHQTVLNVFGDPDGTPGLTNWDRGYLNALYNAELDQPNPRAQAREIASGLATARRGTD